MSVFNGHWYTLDAKAYLDEIPDIDHVKENRLLPSVTTVLSIISKPHLEKWKRDERDKAWFKATFRDNIDFKDAQRIINKQANSVSDGAKEIGSTIHNRLEDYWSKDIGDPSIEKTITTIKSTFPGLEKKFIEEIRVDGRLGYGGKIDFLGTSGNEHILIDYKTQNKPPKDMIVYSNYWLQAAAYINLTCPPGEKCSAAVVVINSKTFEPKVFQKTHEQMQLYWRYFQCALAMFRLELGLVEI